MGKNLRIDASDLNNTELSCEVKVKVAQSRLTLCDPMDYIVHGILQTRILEWVAFPKSLRMVIATMKLKDAYSLEGKL